MDIESIFDKQNTLLLMTYDIGLIGPGMTEMAPSSIEVHFFKGWDSNALRNSNLLSPFKDSLKE